MLGYKRRALIMTNALKKIEKYCSTEQFIIIVAGLTLVLHFIAADAIAILLYGILAGIGFVLFKDFRPSFTLMASALFIVSMQNSPGYTTGEDYYTTTPVLILLAIAVLFVLGGMIIRTIKAPSNLKTGKIYIPFALISAALLIAGIGKEHYSDSVLLSALLVVSGMGLYVLYSGSFDCFDGILDYITSLFSILALLIAFQILGVPVYKMITGNFNDMLENWKRHMIIGWGVNNMGGEMIIFFIPFMFRKLHKGDNVILWTVAIIFSTLMVFFTFCRAAMLFGFPLIAIYAVYAAIKNPQRKKIVVTAVICFAFLSVCLVILGLCTDFNRVFKYFETAFKSSDGQFAWSGRNTIWARRWNYFKEHPVFGSGFAREFYETGAIDKGHTIYMWLAHNFVMEFLGGAGTFGMLALAFFCTSIAIRLIKNKYEGKIFILSALGEYALISLLDTVYFNSYCHIYMIFILVVAEKMIEKEKENTQSISA